MKPLKFKDYLVCHDPDPKISGYYIANLAGERISETYSDYDDAIDHAAMLVHRDKKEADE